jgi:hypothetical protein
MLLHLHPQILTHPWVAQPSVLGHPAVSLFVTHGESQVTGGAQAGRSYWCLHDCILLVKYMTARPENITLVCSLCLLQLA